MRRGTRLWGEIKSRMIGRCKFIAHSHWLATNILTSLHLRVQQQPRSLSFLMPPASYVHPTTFPAPSPSRSTIPRYHHVAYVTTGYRLCLNLYAVLSYKVVHAPMFEHQSRILSRTRCETFRHCSHPLHVWCWRYHRITGIAAC